VEDRPRPVHKNRNVIGCQKNIRVRGSERGHLGGGYMPEIIPLKGTHWV